MPHYCHSTGDAFQLQRDAAAVKLDAERERRERFGEVDVRDTAPIKLAAAYMEPEQCAAMRQFFDAFAEGRPIWCWRAPRFGWSPEWVNMEQLNVLGDPRRLSLCYKTEPPTL
jgi:hypothetical protein